MAKIRFVLSDTGAGHRACAQAVMGALEGQAEFDVVDPLVRSGLPGIERMPDLYDWFGGRPRTWAILWHLLDGPWRARLVSEPVWLLCRKRYVELVNAEQPDLVVVFHPYLTHATRRALQGRRARTALATVITDPVTPHASWFEPNVDALFVATSRARVQAIHRGIPEDRIHQVGHPIHPRVRNLPLRRGALRRAFGWTEPVVLVLGGGSASGTARALAAARGADAQVQVICGRDERLHRELASAPNLEVLGFVPDLPERMCAADVVLTKAGPSTLAECRAVGTPVLITSHMPGQESGNLLWVVEDGFGEWAPPSADLGDILRRWIVDQPRREGLRERAVQLNGTDAAERIAHQLLGLLSPFARSKREKRVGTPPLEM